MSSIRFLLFFVIIPVILTGCATRQLPKFEKPLRRTEFQRVRTTAYTHTEADHRKHGNRTASGSRLRYGAVTSAAADWSRWPVGTVFRIVGTDRVYVVDDYGWALAGRNTIDLYMPNRRMMNAWGARYVKIQVLKWGDLNRSYRIMRPRRKHKHVNRMLKQIERQR